MGRAEWLSEGVEQLAFELLEREAGDEAHCDVVVVGSGYGGAVAAARLAGATPAGGGEPIRLWVLERGREFVPGAFPERFGELFGHVRVDAEDARETWGLGEGLFDLRLGRHVSALLGNGLGGGSLINAGVLARPEREAFERGSWSGLVDLDALEPHFDEVEKMLGATTLPGVAPQKLAALEALAARMDGAGSRRAQIAVTFHKGDNAAGVAQEACLQCADCMTGCNHRAKNTLAMNYLPLAKRRGARLFTGVTVDTIGGEEGAWTLALEFTDTQLRKRFGRKPPLLRARRVVLAAGTYGSTAILKRSRAAGFEGLSKRLGHGFSTNGDMIAVAVGMPTPINASADEHLAPEARRVGPTITGMIDAQHDGVRVTIEELAIPAALRRLFEEVVTNFGALHDLGRVDRSEHLRGPGRDPAAIDPDAIARTAVYASFGDDAAGGRMVLGTPRDTDRHCDDGLYVDWPRVDEQPVFGKAMALLEKAHGKDAIVIPNPMWRLLPSNIGGALEGGEIGGAVFTVHPLGGCAMAASAAGGVVNALGQVYKAGRDRDVHHTLVVLDGSIVPVALGTNPCLTIAALAERAVRALAADEGWNLALADMRDAAIGALPRLPDPPSRQLPWRAPEPTAIRLAERLAGTLTLAGRAYEAVLEIEYAPLADLAAFLRRPVKVMAIPAARLRLRGVANTPEGRVHEDHVVKLVGELTLLERDATTFWRRVRSAGCAWLKNRGKRDAVAGLLGAWRRLRGWIASCWRGERRNRNGATRRPAQGRAGRVRRFFGTITGWIAVASHAGERRLMRYQLEVVDAPAPHAGSAGHAPPLRQGDRLSGTKIIAYVALGAPDCPWPSLWDQLTRLPLVLRSDRADRGGAIGCLEVDLPYWVQQHATQLQIARQDNQPRALADLFSLFAYIARVVGRIHIWSFRAPDYPNPYPSYAFEKAEEERARAAAAALSIRVESRFEFRRPRDLRAVGRFAWPLLRCLRKIEPLERTVVPLDEGDDAIAPQGAFLTHYRRVPPNYAAPEHPVPVLLIHGLGAAGNTFTLPTIECNLVQYLESKGFDPWVLDLRTSIAVPSSKTAWEFDQVARGDIPRAIDAVLARTGHAQVDVVAHCIGAAMFCMAALEGAIEEGRVRAAVLSQVGPLLELPPANRFRGYVASYLKHYLDVDELDTVATLRPRNRFVDRLLATLPYPEQEWALHKHGWLPVPHEAYCLRAYGIYGRLFEHANMNAATLEVLGDVLGHVNYRTYQQTIFYATMRRLTGADGENRYVTYDNIERRLNFPILFLHGACNEVFDKQSSRRSFDLLASIFWSEDLQKLWQDNPARRYDYSLYEQGARLRIVEIEGFGHQDCMIGANAHRKVYPRIAAFLNECVPHQAASQSMIVVRPPRMGPVVGWVREAGGGGAFVARILFAPNASRSIPHWAIVIVLQDRAVRSAHFRALRAGAPAVPDADASPPPSEALDIDLPFEPADFRIVVLTVHKEQFEPEPSMDAGEPHGDDPFGEDLDRFLSGLENLPQKDGEDAAAYAAEVLRCCKDLGLQGEPLPTGRHVNDPRYATPVSTALVSREVLAAARRTQPDDARLCFALASCRYAATIADREAADAAFGRLRDRIEASPEDAPQLLFLAGDNIYADATYGLFDPTDPKDRFDQRYLEAWTAPNAREVLRRLPVYPMLDDHEVEENFAGGAGTPLQRKGLEAFEAFQLRLTPAFETAGQDRPNLASGLPSGTYPYRVRAGDCAFFVADTRAQRRPETGRDSVNASIMRREQMRALRDWLAERQREDPAAPKFVVSPSVVAPWSLETAGHPSHALRADAWDGFPASLHELLGFIAAERIRNVVFLSGDYHCSLFCRMQLRLAGDTPVKAYSIVASGLYAPFPFANTRFNALELDFSGTLRQRLGEHGPPSPGELLVRYRSTEIDCGNAFALVCVERKDAVWQLTIEFDSDRGVCIDRETLAP